MKDRRDIGTMRETAYAKQLEASDRLRSGQTDPVVLARLRERRSFAEGVEAALLWALGDAGSPFAD